MAKYKITVSGGKYQLHGECDTLKELRAFLLELSGYVIGVESYEVDDIVSDLRGVHNGISERSSGTFSYSVSVGDVSKLGTWSGGDA